MPLRFTDCSAIAAVGLFGDRVWTDSIKLNFDYLFLILGKLVALQKFSFVNFYGF